MKRLLLGLTIFGFLAFVGIQSAHSHHGDARDDCRLCMLGGQSVRLMPAAAAAPVLIRVGVPLAERPGVEPQSAIRREASARDPPAA
jgi:hypothetical protein